MELGLYTFADVDPEPAGGKGPEAQRRLKNLIEEIELADQVGLDVFGLGEHHRPDYAASAPAVALAAAAVKTKNIRLSSAVTVLSSDDPVRVFQQFATLDLISNGRAEIMAGRGSFIESFPLFGYKLEDYDQLFEEKLDLLLAIRDGEQVTWSGETRAPIHGRGVYPRPLQQPLPIWIAVGGTPQSVARAGAFGLPLALAIIGGDPKRFRPYVDLYHRAFAEFGRPAKEIAVHSPGFVAATDELAREEYWPAYKGMHDRIGAERGWPPIGRTEFEREVEHGALHLGTPETVARKIAATAKALGIVRFDLKYSAGTLAHDKLMRCIELYGSKVIPLVRDMLA